MVLDATTAWSRGVLRGFTTVARPKGWMLLRYHSTIDLGWLVQVWKPTVVALQWSLHQQVASVLDSCTVISINEDHSARGIASVCVDEAAIATLAAKHLVSKGLRDLTSFRLTHHPFGVARERAFGEAVRAQGARLIPGWWSDSTEPPRSREVSGAILAWLQQLPKPCGIFACCDSWASVVSRYAQVAGVRIPEEVALVGVDNDNLDCELAWPPLSSVCVPWRAVGEQVGALVERVLLGEPVARAKVVVAPVDVVARRSTDVAVVRDALVERATSWIAAHVGRRMTLSTIARATACSRQTLERRFQVAIGRTVMQEVRRARVDLARRLLSTTELPLPLIAKSCGFSSAALLSVAFRRETGTPPGAYRRRFRGASSEEE
jgi:LacI family transcriptional regulator